MGFNFNQYIRSPNVEYTEKVILSNPINENNRNFIYSGLNLKIPDTYYIKLNFSPIFEQVEGNLYIQEEGSTEINFMSFTIPPIAFQTQSFLTKESVILTLESDIDYTQIPLDSFIEITDIEDSEYGNIYQRTDQTTILLVGNRYNLMGFPDLSNTFLEKVLTIRGNKTYTILGITFDKPYLGYSITIEKVKELMNNENYIPYTSIKHLGIQGKSGMKYCINGSELELTSREVEEFFMTENNPIFSVKVVPNNNFFLIDYEYIE